MKKIFKIEGMHCESCSKIIAIELEDKVRKIFVDYKTGKAEVDFDEKKISEKEIADLITKTGYVVK